MLSWASKKHGTFVTPGSLFFKWPLKSSSNLGLAFQNPGKSKKKFPRRPKVVRLKNKSHPKSKTR